MKSNISGLLHFNGNLISFDDGVAYIEKDWGTSFPKSYVWCQSNEFLAFPANFMLSIATIPLGSFNFTGIISDISFENREILESISSKIDVQIKENDKVIFANSGFNSGLEIVI